MKHLIINLFSHNAGIRLFHDPFFRRRSDKLLRFRISAWTVLLIWVAGIGQNSLRAQEIQLNEDPKISQLFRNWTNNNRANPRVEGWRIQIMATPDRQQVEDARNRFRIQYPDVPAEWMHEKPYYKLRVGAFRSRLEAQAFLATLPEYAGAYPARDANIHPRDFLEQ